jgi:transcriptional regulator with XRE-family HTH domain
VTASTYREEYKRFVAVLRQLRLDAGLRQIDVAEALGVPQSFVSKYESGERRLDVIETARLARVLGTDLSHLAAILSISD